MKRNRMLLLCAVLAMMAAHLSAAFAGEAEGIQFPVQIAPFMPRMTLTIACTEDTFDQYGDTIHDYLFTLTVGDGAKVVQAFHVKSQVTLSADHLVSLADLNFDGYMDLDVTDAFFANNMSHLFYLWNPDEKAYVPTELGDLGLSWYALYPDSDIIYSYTHETAATGRSDIYQWRNGELKLLRSMVTRSSDSDTYHAVITDYTDGKRTIIADETMGFDAFLTGYDARETLLWEGIEAGEPLAQ